MKHPLATLAFSFAILFSIFLFSSCDKLEELTGGTKPGKLSGMVQDSVTSAPVSGANVSTLPPTQNVVTDNEGFYLIDIVDPGTYALRASHPDYRTNTVTVTLASGKNEWTNIAIAPLVIPTGGIAGTVLEMGTRAPIPSAQVMLTPGPFTTTTNASGIFNFSTLTPGQYSLTASKAGYANNSVNANVQAGQMTPVEILLGSSALAKGTINIMVMISTTDGVIPAQGATVTATPGNLTRLTNAIGVAEFTNLDFATYLITVSLPGYQNSSVSLNLRSDNTPQNWSTTLIPSTPGSKGSITGTVRQAGPNEPVLQGVTITVQPSGKSALTDAYGNYSITGLDDGTYQVKAEFLFQGGIFESQTKSAVISGGNMVTLDFSLQLLPTVPGRIGGTVSGRYPDGRIELLPEAEVSTQDGYKVLTDPGGRYELTLPPGTYVLTATKTGFTSQSSGQITVTSGLETPWNVILSYSGGGGPTTGSIRGTVRDATSLFPIPGVSVTTDPASSGAITNSSGDFEIANLPFGTYQITLTSEWYVTHVTFANLQSTTGVQVNVNMERRASGGVFIGRVVDELTKAPLADANMFMNDLSRGTTNSSGYYIIIDVPVGTHRIKATKTGYNEKTINYSMPGAGDTVMVNDISLMPSGGGNGSISGYVRSLSSGAPINQAAVSTSPSTVTVYSQSTGNYAILNVPPGNYTLSARHGNFADTDIANVQVGSTNVALDIYSVWGKYSSNMIVYYPLRTTWKEWYRTYWGPSGDFTIQPTVPEIDRFGNVDGARRFRGGEFLLTEPFGNYQSTTMTVWIKPDILTRNSKAPIFAYSTSASREGWQVCLEDEEGKLSLSVYAHNSDNTFSKVATGFADGSIYSSWGMVSVVTDHSSGVLTVRLYYSSGVTTRLLSESTVSVPRFTGAAMQQVSLGRALDPATMGYSFYRGILDDVRLFNGVLTVEQINHLFTEQ